MAARMGSAAFFEPEMRTVPERREPPWTRILSMRGDDEALAALEVAQGGYVGEVFFREQVADAFRLIFADFEGEEALKQGRCGLGSDVFDEGADEGEAVGAAIESEVRVALDFSGEGLDFVGRDVGKVGDDEVEGFGKRGCERALVKGDAGGEFEGGRVFFG